MDFKEIEMHENDKDNNSQQKQTRVILLGSESIIWTHQPSRSILQATHPLIRTSQVSLSSNPDADFRYSTIFTPIGIYKGQLYAIKKVRKKCIDITREMKMELKMVSGLNCELGLGNRTNILWSTLYSFVIYDMTIYVRSLEHVPILRIFVS